MTCVVAPYLKSSLDSEYAMLLQMISQLQAEKENAQRQIAQLLAQIQGTNVAYNNFGYSSM